MGNRSRYRAPVRCRRRSSVWVRVCAAVALAGFLAVPLVGLR